MRKVLLFLLVFGVGLAVLLIFRSTPNDPSNREQPAPAATNPDAFTDVDVPLADPKKAGKKSSVGIVLDGPVAFTQRKASGSELKPEIELRTSDVDAVEENVYDAHDLHIDVFEPSTGKKRAELTSPLSRIVLTAAHGTLRLSDNQPIKLTNVDLTLNEGGPVVPMRLQVPELLWSVSEASFRSNDRVRITGNGLEAEGTGLRAFMNESSLQLDRDASISLQLENDLQATLTSGPSGPIALEKIIVGGVETIDLVAKDGARLAVSGAQPVEIHAGTIHLVGRESPGETPGFRINSADAEGDVVATSRADTFRAQHAEFHFGAEGRLERATLDRDVTLQAGSDEFHGDHAVFEFDSAGNLQQATLTGEPRGAVDVARFLPKGRRETTSARGEVSGRGPLVVDRVKNEVDLAGPAKLVLKERGLVLEARDRIVARDAGLNRKGDLAATGAVVLDWEKSKIESEALTIAWDAAGAKSAAVTAISNGKTTVHFVTREGNAYTLVAHEGLEAKSVGDKLIVPAARGVVLTSDEPSGNSARADLVRDLDLSARTFKAEGDVTFDSIEGNGSASRVEALARETYKLHGEADKPATFHFARATPTTSSDVKAEAKGLEIEVNPGRIDAEGDVRAFVETAQSRLDLSGAKLTLQIGPEGQEPRKFHTEVDRAVHALLVRPGEKADVTSERLVVDGTIVTGRKGAASSTIADPVIRAERDIIVSYSGAGEIEGQGDLFTLDEHGRGRLSADAGRRVRAKGRIVETVLPYTIDADWVEFDSEHVDAAQMRTHLDPPADAGNAAGANPPSSARGPGAERALLHELRAQKLHADRHEIVLEGAAHIEGITLQNEAWVIDAGSIRIRGDFTNEKAISTDKLTSLVAEDGFDAELGARLSAHGDRLEGARDKIRIEGRPARMSMLAAEWQSPWLEYDMENMLLSTDKGHLSSKAEDDGPSWSLDYESMQPFETPDKNEALILVLRNPRLRFGPQQLFADWALFWVDREEWRKSGQKVMTQPVDGSDVRVLAPDTQTPPKPNAPKRQRKARGALKTDYMAALSDQPLFRVLSEVYIESNVEFFQEAEREVRASALYLDLRNTQGWIQDPDIHIRVEVRGFRQDLRAKAKWMRISPGPSLQAADALLTSCGFDDPHYVIETGDLRITPTRNERDERVKYRVTAADNRLRLENGFKIPLPSIAPDLDEEGTPLIDRFVLGNSAKYGAQIGATFNTELGPAGKATGTALSRVLRLPEVDLRGNWKFNVGILGSRGLLLGAGLKLSASDKFTMLAELDAIPDRGNDRGLVRVAAEDRTLLREWFRVRSRYRVSDREWFDLAVSKQSDPGVQSEFFERQYVRYEQKDTYLHWRKALDQTFLSASAKVLIEDRRDSDELPSVGILRGRTEIGELYDQPIYYTGRADAGYFQRREGDVRYYRPFEDGLGNREVLRFDTEHRLEVPFNLGFLAARGTPYLSARATAWDRGVLEDGSIGRAALIAGFEASTTFWKRFAGGSIHTITPTIGVHADIASLESDEVPVRFDATEDAIGGQFIDAGIRTRWVEPETKRRVDLDVRTSHGSNVDDETKDGLQPIAVRGDALFYWKDVPFGVTHDGRYDTRSGATEYSLTSLGFEPWDNVGLEFGHQRGLSTATEERLFESASVAARWRWTTKWEVEIQQSYSIAQGTGLGNNLVLRRMGHDFITEIEVGYRAGEGSAVSIGFQPRLTWKRSRLGLLDRSLGVYH